MNFLNKKNAADQRVYQLLDEKFKLFDGVFGASDEVLGAVESGVDFEKRIASIYQQCRTAEQIDFEFEQLQLDLFQNIAAGQQDAREKLLNNFDQEVVERVRVQSTSVLDRFSDQLWQITRQVLAPYATFADTGYAFSLDRSPFPDLPDLLGRYQMSRDGDGGRNYRMGHPLALKVVDVAKSLDLGTEALIFDYRQAGRRISIVEPLVGKSGWLRCSVASLRALEVEDHLVVAGFADDGTSVDQDQLRRLLELPATSRGSGGVAPTPTQRLEQLAAAVRLDLINRMSERNAVWFETEMDKLDRWADDRRTSLRAELADLDAEIKEAKKAARLAPTLPDKLNRQRELRVLESRRDDAWRAFDAATREIDQQKDALLDDITARLDQQSEESELFTLRWSVV